MAGVGSFQSLWERPIWEGVWPNLDPMDSVCFAHSVHGMECVREVWAAWRALFLPDSGGARVAAGLVRLSVPSSMLTSAPPSFLLALLFVLRIIAEEGRDGEEFQGLGDEWKMGCPKSPVWESEGEAWSEDEDASFGGSREDNVCDDALHVVGLYGPGDKISLFPAG